mmetsp:Transcript_26602/g.45285  ORF Transcript_26602/g.45285 Transcript_26602/m.45285 type:complete len:202 (+) Transcript_26602:177-782(+)
MDSPLSQCKHTRFRTNSLTLSTTSIHHLLRNSVQINIPEQVHFTRMNLHNCHTILSIGIGKFNLTINSTRTQQCRIQYIDTIGGHDDLDILRWFKPIQLIQQFQHGTLHLGVSSTSTPRLTNGINLIHKDNTWCRLTCHDEQFTDHPRSLPNILLNQLCSTHTDKGTIGMMCHRTCQQRLSRPRRSIQQHSLWLRDTQTLK